MKTKYSIRVNHGEKELYHTCKDLTIHGRATIDHPDRYKRNSISRMFAIRSKPLIERGLLYPPFNNRDSHQIKKPMTVVFLPTDVNMTEKLFSNFSRFYVRRKK